MSDFKGRHFEGGVFRDNQVWENYKAVLDACCNAWNKLISTPAVIQSIGTRDWA
jgi:hypothetical protein